MKILISLVGLFTLWATTLNSGQTSQIWILPTLDKQTTLAVASSNNTTDEKTAVEYSLVDSGELECMSKNIYFEAALESTACKMAVAQVTKNRVRSIKYPNTFCGVIKQGKHYENGFPVRDRCQFSWYCDGKDDNVPHKGSMWRESQKVAEYVLLKPDLMDITDGATHYHADYISSPKWAHPRRKTVEIDTHIFFNHARKQAKTKIYKGKKT